MDIVPAEVERGVIRASQFTDWFTRSTVLTDFLVAALQITSTSDVEANFVEAEEQIELAARRGAELIGLPENFAFLGDDEEKLRLASDLSVKCTNFLKTMSQRYQVFLLGGYPVPAGDDSHTLNRSALFEEMDRFWQNMTKFTCLMLICQMEIYTRNHQLFYLERNIRQL